MIQCLDTEEVERPSGGLFDPGLCRGRTPGPCRSESGSEFVECGGRPERLRGVYGLELVRHSGRYVAMSPLPFRYSSRPDCEESSAEMASIGASASKISAVTGFTFSSGWM